jgi:hypothetical protein
MELISTMRGVYNKASWSREDRDNICRHYWRGGGSIDVGFPGPNLQRVQHTTGEIWEHLIEGQLKLLEPLERA